MQAHTVIHSMKFSVLVWVVVTSLITLVGTLSSTGDRHTFISGTSGTDVPSCINNKTNPCQSLEYVFIELKSSYNTSSHHEYVLLGDQYLSSSVTVVGIDGLVLRGLENCSTIYCLPPNTVTEAGGGFKFMSVSNVHIVNLTLKGCGTLQNNTTLRSETSAQFRTAMYFLNCSSVAIDTCVFLQSRGRALTFSDTSGEINITNSLFAENSAPEVERGYFYGSGALLIDYTYYCAPNNNTVVVYNTEFVNNSGWYGGAVAIWSSPIGNDVFFNNCTWYNNSATIGSAISVFGNSEIFHARLIYPSITLEDCLFVSNKLNDTHDNIDSGVLHVQDSTITFFGHNTEFSYNIGSAVFARSSMINMSANGIALFKENTARCGAAMALSGNSNLKLGPNTTIRFESNHAEVGGALSYTSQHDYLTSHNCFISYESEIDPEKWNTSLIFINNTAMYGSAIYVDTLLPCAMHAGEKTNNVSEALRWKNFQYLPPLEEHTISTNPARIAFELPAELAPGETVQINPLSFDELNQTISATYEAKIEGNLENIRIERYIGGDGHLHVLNGTPGSTFTVTIKTVGSRCVSAQQTGTLSKCPVGFVLEGGKCVCSTENRHQYVGITECKENEFKSHLRLGFWAGCVGDDTVVTAECPIGYCNRAKDIADTTVLSRSCLDIAKQDICSGNRRGQLCGECMDGYSVFYHSQDFKCDKCSDGALGLLVYLASEVIPLCLFFVSIVIFQFNLASGRGQSFTFFVQVALLLSYKPIPHEKDIRATHVLIVAFHFLFGPLNLDFFKSDITSFCLWNGATALDILAFKYVTVVLGLILLTFLIVFFKWCFSAKVPKKLLCGCGCVKKEHFSKTTPIINSIATFLIVFYDQITVTSFQILARAELYGEGGTRVKSVVAVSGSVDYFGGTHVLYALPALLVILTLSIPPPLILISYPLLWKLKARLQNRKKVEKAYLQVNCILLPLIERFQDNYHDRYRFFSGFIFLWRIFITATIAFCNASTYYLLITAILTVKLFLYGIIAPHLCKFNNRMDMFAVATLLAINTLDWFKFTNTISYHHNQIVTVKIASVVKVFLLYLPIILICLRCTRKKCSVLKNSRLYHNVRKAIILSFQEQGSTQACEEESDPSSLYHEDSGIGHETSFSKYT